MPATETDLNSTLDWMREHAAPNHTIGLDINAQPDSLFDWLHAQGFSLKGAGIARFVRSAPVPVIVAESRYVVRQMSTAAQDEFGHGVQQAFGFPPSIAQWMSRLAGRDRWHTYHAYGGEILVAVAAMFIDRGTAWLGAGGTIEQYQRGGAQSLLLARRIHDAIELGADRIHVETGHPDGGQEIGPSYRNILRAGFKLLFVRREYAAVQPVQLP